MATYAHLCSSVACALLLVAGFAPSLIAAEPQPKPDGKESTQIADPNPSKSPGKAPDPAQSAAKKVPAPPERVFIKEVRTSIPGYEVITMVVRLPKGHSADKKPARIFAYCYYFAEAKSVIAQAKNDKAQWNEFADKHGFATLSWNTQTLWASRKSQDELNRWDFMNQDREFDVAARAWERGLADLCRTHNLQDTDLLLYGCSRGAHFALRLAMRQGTKRFSAVHAHVPNSFEKPLKKSEETVWLISNGDMDTGTTNARRFYQQARDSNFPIFIKFFRGLGHAESPESLKFSRSFFELFLKREASGENVAKELSQALDDPQYTFDLLNDVSFPVAKSSYVPESQRIPLPDEEFASVWGRIIR